MSKECEIKSKMHVVLQKSYNKLEKKWNSCIWINTYDHIVSCLLPGHLPNTVSLLSGFEIGEISVYHFRAYLSIWKIKHISKKNTCENNCLHPVAIWKEPDGDEFIHSSSSKPRKNFIMVTNAVKAWIAQWRFLLMVQSLGLWHNVTRTAFMFSFQVTLN